MPATSSPVYEVILQEIRKKGPMPFRHYMELALYAPEGGYYTGDREKLGPSGDFITSPEISPLFGAAIAIQLKEMWVLLGRPAPFTLLEFGPGSGALAHSILEKAWADEELATVLRYILVETSPHLAAEQQRRLAAYPVQWCTKEELPPIDAGVVLTNEFLDALPVHRVKMKDATLQEIYVAEKGEGEFQDQLGPLTDRRLAAYFTDLGLKLAEDQEGEVNLLALEWLTQIDRILKRGFILTVDYGFPARELYALHRMQGTLLGYHRHQAILDPYLHVGTMDLTAHVDFSSLKNHGETLGFATLGFTNQMWFLLSTGILSALQNRPPETAEEFRLLQTIKKLLMPGGMGEIFKILIQGKGIGSSPLLGLRERPLPGSKTWSL